MSDDDSVWNTRTLDPSIESLQAEVERLRKDRAPIEEIKHQLSLPVCGPKSDTWGTSEAFNPWEAFPAFYGSYSSEFDDMAILVLENIRDKTFGRSAGEGLAHEMFRELLCTSGLCDYGTSPRGCFPDPGTDFEELLRPLIDKWKEYRKTAWED